MQLKDHMNNLNALARRMQHKNIALVLAGIGALLVIGWLVMGAPAAKTAKSTTKPQPPVDLAGALDPQFTKDASQKVLEEQQGQLKQFHEQIEMLSMQLDGMQKLVAEKNANPNASDQVLIQELQARIAELEQANKKPLNPTLPGAALSGEAGAPGITTTTFTYEPTGAAAVKPKTMQDYVPPGSFAKAVLLSGADTNAGTHGQADTVPITMRILDQGTLPNGARSSLKGCFVTAAAYGDASSERGQIRLQRLSCVRGPDKHILDIPVEGTINDMGGSDGIRGHVVMRNNKLIWNAGISGVLSGLGGAAQQSLTTQSVSPLGATSTIQPNRVFQAGMFGGANTALSKLADYYIKLADMYHPIVQVHAGSQVNIVFLKGFSLMADQVPGEVKPNEPTKTPAATNESANLMVNTQNLNLGQTVEVNPNSNEVTT